VQLFRFAENMHVQQSIYFAKNLFLIPASRMKSKTVGNNL
jgi:hypothetical protein